MKNTRTDLSWRRKENIMNNPIVIILPRSIKKTDLTSPQARRTCLNSKIIHQWFNLRLKEVLSSDCRLLPDSRQLAGLQLLSGPTSLMLFDFSPKLKIHQTFLHLLFFWAVFVWRLDRPFAHSLLFLSSGSCFVTAEDVVQINIWRHVEHEEWYCLESEGYTRIMPVTGNIWWVNSCGETNNARGSYQGAGCRMGWGLDSRVPVVFLRREGMITWW